MSRARIVPRLRDLVEVGPRDGEHYRDARVELRALLAVARAARDIEHPPHCAHRTPKGCACEYGRLKRARARLDAVSGRKP